MSQYHNEYEKLLSVNSAWGYVFLTDELKEAIRQLGLRYAL